MNVTVEFKGLKELISDMDDLAKKQVPFALSRALNKTAEDMKAEMVREMPSRMDRPTPFTMNALYIRYANKGRLAAEIGYKDKSQAGKGNPAANWMQPQVEGGPRNIKRFERALQMRNILPRGMYIAPGEACPLDAYGNIPGSFIVQILSYFRAFGEQGYRANITDKRKASLKRGSKKSGFGFEYFVAKPNEGWSTSQHLPPGIWKRVQFAGGSAIKPIMMFVKTPSYQKRFPFYGIATKVIDNKLMQHFDAEMREAIRTAKLKG
jgi:hypothetical protein